MREQTGRHNGKLEVGGSDFEHINGIPTRILGRTAVRVTVLGVGGADLGRDRDTQLGIRIIRSALDEGVNFLDNAWCYNDGESEIIMGHALRDGYREKAFLMTKNHGRDGATFRHQLHESLRRLQTDYIDLLQFHQIETEGEPDQIFMDGPLEEALKAREDGKIKFIGFSGHRWPHLFKEMLEKDFEWDTVQLPTNPLDYHYRSFTRDILPTLVERGIGIISMKSLAGIEGRPYILETGITAREAISYALSLPIHTLVSGIDSMEILTENLEIVRNWRPLSEEERGRLLERIAPWAADGSLEIYKTA